jgi:hypothetical protein
VTARWIFGFAAYATMAAAADPHLVSLSVEPGRRTLENAGSHQQLLAIGKYEDGSTRDLTGQAQWTVSDPSLASVDREGMLKAVADGKVARLRSSTASALRRNSKSTGQEPLARSSSLTTSVVSSHVRDVTTRRVTAGLRDAAV